MDAYRPDPGPEKYAGKDDYQGNRDVYEMPEEHKPSEAKSSLHGLVMAIAVGTALVFLILAVYSMTTQSGSFL